MKLRSLLPMAAFAALVLTGCSKDDVVAPNQEPTVTEGYATFKINLPSTPGSRAATYENGETYEYAVKNVRFLIFSKTGSEDPKFLEEASVSGNGNPWGGGSTSVTTSSNVTAKIGKISTGSSNTYYVVALLNGATITAPTANQTYNEWIAVAQNEENFKMSKNEGFFMSNALLGYAGPENDYRAISLVAIDTDKLGKTAAEAQLKGEAATIYVERAAAKVEVATTELANWTYTVGTSTDQVTINGWALDNTNKTGFPIKNITNAFNFVQYFNRFLGQSIYELYHSFDWCVDPNYESYTASSDFKKVDLSTWNGLDAAAYCLENTMDAGNSNKDAATRVVFKTEYKLGGAAAETLIKFNNKATLYKSGDFKTYVENNSGSLSGVTFALRENIEGGYKSIKEVIKIVEENGEETSEDTKYDQLAATLGLTNATAKEISYYKNGIVYYPAYIKHIDIADNAADKLGKYGVVRNNWYELVVKTISAIGEPERPGGDVIDPDPIDEDKSYLDVQINILKWAKRTQNVEL